MALISSKTCRTTSSYDYEHVLAINFNVYVCKMPIQRLTLKAGRISGLRSSSLINSNAFSPNMSHCFNLLTWIMAKKNSIQCAYFEFKDIQMFMQ